MEAQLNWKRIHYIIGVILMIAGALDPMEGSIAIAAGSILIIITTQVTNDRHRTLFLLNGLLICFGVIALFYLSSIGGFGGNSKLSYWWGLAILPYPIGWLLMMGLLIYRKVKPKSTSDQLNI